MQPWGPFFNMDVQEYATLTPDAVNLPTAFPLKNNLN